MDQFSDEELYQQIRLSERKAFNMLFDRYWKRLFEYAYRLLQDRAQAEDVVQEVFLSFWQKRQGQPITHISGYFFRAVKFQVANSLRNNKWLVAWPEENPVVLEEKEEELQDRDLLYEQLEESIQRLSPRCQEVFHLNKKEGFTAREIALRLNISPRTVEHQLHKAMKALRGDLQKFYSLILIFLYL